MLVNMNVKEFVSETASDSPVPGGGSIAALAGAISAGLTEMVANLTVGKKKYVEVEDEMKDIVEKASKLREQLIVLVDKDATSFDGVMKAFKLPKETEEEKAERTATIQKEMKYAATVPLETAKIAAEIMALSEIVIEKGNSNAVTDGAVSAMMCRTAILSALLNVKINLSSIKDEAFVAETQVEVEKLEKFAVEREAEVLKKVQL